MTPVTAMIPADDCADCAPAYLQRRLDSAPPSILLFSSLPFIATWLVVAIIAWKRLFMALSGDVDSEISKRGLPQHKDTGVPVKALYSLWDWKRTSAQGVASLVFSTSIGLSAVLVELLLCEISGTLHPAARSLALRITLSSLLVLSILVTPALELHGLVKTLLGTPVDSTSTRKTRARFRVLVEAALFTAWLAVFWYIPQTSILKSSLHNTDSDLPHEHPFTEACLERIGIIGISLMASLAGFAAVSSLWQNFGVRHRKVTENDVARKEAGLNATEEMLNAKQSRLRALQRKLSEAGSSKDTRGFMSRIAGSVRGSTDHQEQKALQMEISGLETMRYTLSSTVSTMRTRFTEQQRSKTSSGKFLNLFNTGFALYCAYRICATSISSLRRWWQPTSTFATSDPINNVLALLTTHWDSNLDRAAWSRQISFLLSGIMLMASFNAVLQTFRLFARFAPGLLQHAQTSLPLIISQVAGTYVISSALLLRSNLPPEVSSVITEALGAPLEGRFVEAWFESWFLVAVGLTATGILIGRKVGSGDEDWDDLEGVEMGKMS
nr:hypothetical protein B0A51_01542 [Rachicladosporium sp. CCFEE 5018]